MWVGRRDFGWSGQGGRELRYVYYTPYAYVKGVHNNKLRSLLGKACLRASISSRSRMCSARLADLNSGIRMANTAAAYLDMYMCNAVDISLMILPVTLTLKISPAAGHECSRPIFGNTTTETLVVVMI